VVSQRRNSIQGVQLFGRGGAHRSEVADVAIVAVAGRRISFFEFTHTPARASVSSVCDLAQLLPVVLPARGHGGHQRAAK